MLRRCDYPKNKSYKYYGARGISVCDRWFKFKNFLEDMGPRPKGYSLDRIDNNKGYSKENCRWATAYSQVKNSRHAKYGGPIGVTFHKSSNKWLAVIPKSLNNGNKKYIGSFPTKKLAAKAIASYIDNKK